MTSEGRFIIEKLRRSHDCANFDCGNESLNEYLQRYAHQNAGKGIGATYVACGEGEARVLAYYTLSSGQVARESLPTELSKGIPRYPVPVVRLGRLAVDLTEHGQGMGGLMLVDALRKAASLADIIGICAVEVDAKNDSASRFYRKYGFQSLLDDRNHLFLPIKAVRKLFI